jgi:N-acetylglucosaminyl-diphospho-decaprenol L-rhamnosyltransferase
LSVTANDAPADPLVSIIIAAYGAPEAMHATLGSLIAHTADPCEIIVVDSGVEDCKGVQEIAEAFPVTYIQVPNGGFAAANNAGIRRARAPFLVLLNPDVVLYDDAIGRLVRLLQRDPSIGCVGPGLRRPDGSVQPYAFGTEPRPWFLLSRGLKRLAAMRHGLEGISGRLGTQPIAVDWVAGTCLVTREDVLKAVGLLDERYFLYWEDVDWCLRVRKHGWRVVLDPGVMVTHVGGASTGATASAHYYRSLVEFYRKWYGDRWALLLAMLLRIYAPLVGIIRRRRWVATEKREARL